MIGLFLHGVKKSVLFNHVLNLINAIVLAIIVFGGMFFINLSNWDDFMPFGINGVLKGSATAFYAMIGFDIIATTGAESRNPREQIPRSIIATIILITSAYVLSSGIMTLMGEYLLPTAKP